MTSQPALCGGSGMCACVLSFMLACSHSACIASLCVPGMKVAAEGVKSELCLIFSAHYLLHEEIRMSDCHANATTKHFFHKEFHRTLPRKFEEITLHLLSVALCK